MPKNFYTKVKLDDGREAEVHVNRRGCTGRWTKADADALAALTKAVLKMTPEQIAAVSARRPSREP